MGTKTAVPRRLFAAGAAGGVALALAAQLPAAAAPGPGTWTKVSSPHDGAAVLRQSGHEGHWTIKGTASADVTEVNVYCLSGSGSAAQATTVATAVSVSSGAFSATVPVPGGVGLPQCRLRALPDGVNPQAAYLSSYAGPVVNLDSWTTSGGSDFVLTASAGSTMVTATSVGSCSTDLLAVTAADQTVSSGSNGCVLSLGSNAAGTRSGVVVDGHQAISPAAANRYGVTPRSTVRVSVHTTTGGGVRWTDTEGLDRCATDTFPPSPSCTLRTTGVEVRQVLTLLKAGQVRVRSEFRSTDGRRHVVRLAYTNVVTSPTPGELGVRFPGQKTFRAARAGRKVTKLGRGAGAVFARTNRFGDEGDPAVATRALSWSRPPSQIRFSPTNESAFELDYRLVVPKGGSAHLGFADSVGVRTTTATRLAARGERDMMPAPRITAPAAGSTVKGAKTKVTGVVRSGANGLPASVTVNGHVATLKPSKSGLKATYSVTFSEAPGKHTITAVARDGFGNKRSTSVKVRTR